MCRVILSLLCNAAIVVWTVVAVWRTVRRNGNEAGKPADAFRYFTTDSNLLSGAAALLITASDIALLVRGGDMLPEWAVAVKYVGTVAVMVTFLTVMVFLGPAASYKEMFADEGLFLHLIGPLLAALSFCALDPGAAIRWGQTALGVLPTLLYGGLYLVMVVIIGADRGGWEDFYGFNKGGKWPVSVALMLVGTYALCILLLLLRRCFV